MLDTSNPFSALKLVSWMVWKIPSRRPTKMAEFSHTEAGSSLDMMDAAEEASSPALRRKFFRHAIDEFRHARLFAARSVALSSNKHAVAVLEDSEYATSHGIRGKSSLYGSLGETEFLAFVWLHECKGANQFAIYSELMKRDAASSAMFAEICRDEQFHISYSRRELERIESAGGAAEVRAALRRLRLRGAREEFLRISRGFGDFVAGVWLLLIYLAVFGPFVVLARRSVGSSGIVATPGSLARARAGAGLQG